MKHTHTLNKLGIAVALLAGANSASAITPWTSGYATPDYVIFASGGAAQDSAIDDVVKNTLAATGTLDVFRDATTTSQASGSWGSNFTGYYFIGSSNLPANLQGKKIYFGKRSRGAAGYGVIPVLAGTAIDQLYIFNTPTANASQGNTASYGNWTQNTIDGSWGQVIDTTTSGLASIVQHFSHGGFTGVDSESLVLNSQSRNYPAQTTEYSTNANTSPWNTSAAPSDLSALSRIPTGGLTYGIAVTTDLYKVLQAAQIANGKLPATTTIGDYSNAASLPSLSRDFVASVLAGKISDWNNVEVNLGNGTSATLVSFASTAGVTAPTVTGGLTPIGVGIRNNGAAVGAAAYATFLNYPYAENSTAPAAASSQTKAVFATQHPAVVAATGVNNTGALLFDWQTGANTSKLNPNSAKYWGIAIDAATANDLSSTNTTIGANWRFVKIDGYAPTVENVSSGSYPFWAEGEVVFQSAAGYTGATGSIPTIPLSSDIQGFLTTFANDLGSIRVGASVNPQVAQPWGNPGIFATTASHPVGGSVALDIPFQISNPLVPLSHVGSDGYTHLGVRPVATVKTDIIELK